jgi:hypothetical protein
VEEHQPAHDVGVVEAAETHITQPDARRGAEEKDDRSNPEKPKLHRSTTERKQSTQGHEKKNAELPEPNERGAGREEREIVVEAME